MEPFQKLFLSSRATHCAIAYVKSLKRVSAEVSLGFRATRKAQRKSVQGSLAKVANQSSITAFSATSGQPEPQNDEKKLSPGQL
jgi:hypothetical protein